MIKSEIRIGFNGTSENNQSFCMMVYDFLQGEVVGNTYREGCLMRRQAGGSVALQHTTETTVGRKCELWTPWSHYSVSLIAVF